MSPPPDGRLGVVVIGRNEGAHLERVLRSAVEAPEASAVVYADSDSTDGSVERVRSRFPEVQVVQLSRDDPLSPALGRNAGFDALVERLPGLELVMFLDGDCELAPGWLGAGRDYLDTHPEHGIVIGRLREREPHKNRYHRLADMEWNRPAGEITESGGIMMVRARTWRDAGGQNPYMPAGEEKEFYLRALRAGWRARRLDADMALHDIDMGRFAEWWTRSERLGHSWVQGLWIHRDRENLRQVASIGLYGALLPGFAVGAALPTLGISLTSLWAYRRLHRRIEADRLCRGDPPEDAKLYATAVVVGKVAGAVGVARFFLRTLPQGRGGRSIRRNSS